jgi:hypothetical protein
VRLHQNKVHEDVQKPERGKEYQHAARKYQGNNTTKITPKGVGIIGDKKEEKLERKNSHLTRGDCGISTIKHRKYKILVAPTASQGT